MHFRCRNKVCIISETVPFPIGHRFRVTDGTTLFAACLPQLSARRRRLHPFGLLKRAMTSRFRILLPLASAALVPAQTRPEFEAASIKPNTSGGVNVAIAPHAGGRLNAENMTLKFLIQLAYKVSESEIQGGPSWISSARYDIVAKANMNTPFPDMSPMLQCLIEDRFKLAFHRETRELPVYFLAAAKGTPKPPESADCKPVACGTIRMTSKRLDGARINMNALTKALSVILGGIVIDQTGFEDHFDAHLEWDAVGPSIFTTLREQLGLKLESGKAPVEVLVIDHAEKPVED